MEKVSGKIYKTVTYIIACLGIAFTGFLFVSALLYDSYTAEINCQLAIIGRDNQIWTIVVFLIFVIICAICALLCKKDTKKVMSCHLFLTLLWILFMGLLLIYFVRSSPSADARSVYNMAESLAAGDLSFIHPTESYLAFYPHQIGLVVFYAPFLWVWNMLGTGLHGFLGLEVLNIFMAMTTVVFQFLSIDCFEVKEKEYIKHLYLFMAGTFLPFIAYTSFVYGEIPSVMFMSGALFFALKLKKEIDNDSKRTLSYAFLLILFSFMAVLVRKNSLIFIIAITAVLLVEFILHRKPALMISLVAILILSICGQTMILGVFERVTGTDMPSGVTSLSFIAMGMQEGNGSNNSGWYNGFNYNTYIDSGLDGEKADEISRAVIKERREFFAANKDKAFSFYKEKYLTQWADGTYFFRKSLLNSSSRKNYVWPYLNGVEARPYINYCNGYQSILYAGLFLFCIIGLIRMSKGCNLVGFIGIIALFGTMMFHFLWEADARYGFPVISLVLPYAAMGWGTIGYKCFKRVFNNDSKKKS